jgi:hypothetical protein
MNCHLSTRESATRTDQRFFGFLEMSDCNASLVCECEAGNITRKNRGPWNSLTNRQGIFTRSGAVLELQMMSGKSGDLNGSTRHSASDLTFIANKSCKRWLGQISRNVTLARFGP